MTNTTKGKAPAPPKHLGPEGKALWKGILDDWEITDGHDLARLQVRGLEVARSSDIYLTTGVPSFRYTWRVDSNMPITTAGVTLVNGAS